DYEANTVTIIGVQTSTITEDQADALSSAQQPTGQARNQATLTVSMASGAPNPSGVDFPRGDGVGPADAPGQGWYYNVLLTGTIGSGEASQYEIRQTVKVTGSEVTETGGKFKLDQKRDETIAPTATKYWAVKGNKIFGLDSPGLKNTGPDNQFVK